MPQELTVALVLILVVCAVIFGVWKYLQTTLRNRKNMERALKMVPMLIHLPPSTDDIQGGGRDERDVANEEISKAVFPQTRLGRARSTRMMRCQRESWSSSA